MVEPSHDLRLPVKPGAAGRGGVHMDAQGDPALEERIGGEEQQPLVGRRDQPLDLEEALELGDVRRNVVHARPKLTRRAGRLEAIRAVLTGS